jgi:hypothetical protein
MLILLVAQKNSIALADDAKAQNIDDQLEIGDFVLSHPRDTTIGVRANSNGVDGIASVIYIRPAKWNTSRD